MQQLYGDRIARAEFVPLGGDVRGYYAVPAGAGPFPAVLVFQEAFGVNDYIQSEARRLAARGYAALAPDLYRGETYPTGDMTPVRARMKLLTDEGMLADVRTAAAFLDAQADVKHGAYGAVGFCLGGRLAVLTAIALGARIAAAAGYYGGGIAPLEPGIYPSLLDRLPDAEAELLLVYGADDDAIVPAEHARIARTLSAHMKRYALSVYPGAPHGFASRDRPDRYRPAQAEAAWVETMALFDRTLR